VAEGGYLKSQPYCNEVKFKPEIKLKENKSDISENHITRTGVKITSTTTDT
jgi:hypothetical protein